MDVEDSLSAVSGKNLILFIQSGFKFKKKLFQEVTWNTCAKRVKSVLSMLAGEISVNLVASKSV